ncbi:hypothetical protein TTHERM_00322830 (macronuclear) [Tetrahymena thermophila SB210]|uniref:Uncharacterized protein n=1 Tax=Tetrahymena thermophila (strain SB210) TaxID=312017 RepID=Q237K2_TETTS|nr:hypothetical protein TTHERM_00322830 [Tetrahymena thermophila SB210]EAR92739.2 hypothetical protein TTHERM_00322830 [Tetrahymena thermophila SB210]|eukprot:XP_001012984.2 hypothetical protein TTHERM_00322830 [Tetrahymena thermophila SB210]
MEFCKVIQLRRKKKAYKQQKSVLFIQQIIRQTPHINLIKNNKRKTKRNLKNKASHPCSYIPSQIMEYSDYDSQVALNNASQFNQKIEEQHKKQCEIQLNAQKKEVEDKISKVLSELGNMSKNSKEALGLFQQLSQLSPLLTEIGAQVKCVGDELFYKLYMQYRNVFKEFQENVNECNVISQQSLQGHSDPQKMKQIRESIIKIANKLSNINKNVYQQSQRYVIWVDFNDSKDNKQTLIHIQKLYETSLVVKFYTDVNKFKQDYSSYKGQPIFLILSGQVANDYASSDGRLFSWIKNEWLQKKEDNRIRGIIIYTSDQGVKFLKNKFESDESKLVKRVTANTNEMLEVLSGLITPSKFCRVIGIEEFSALFQNNLKNKLTRMHITPPTNPLSYYSPQNFDYSKMFNEAYNTIKKYKINFQPDAMKFDEVLDEIKKIYSKYPNNEQKIAQQMIYLYSLEKIPFYKLINTTLNTLNEALILVMMPLIELFQTAIFKFDDSSFPESIQKGQPKKMYRGSSIPDENYDQLIKPNELICLPSFSSFTEDIEIAKRFLKLNNFSGTKECIFVYEHKMGSAQFDIRPKYVSPESFFKQEKEYITYPCVAYKIQSIQQKETYPGSMEKGEFYNEITLILN